MNEVDLCLLLPLCVLYEMKNQIFQHPEPTGGTLEASEG